MNWDAIGAIGELVGAVAVFATLFYLARQIRHSSEAQERANQLAQAESVTSSNTLIMNTWAELARDSELADIYNRGTRGMELNEVEGVRYVAFVNMYLNWLEVLYTQANVELGFSEVEGREDLMGIAAPYVKKLLGNESGKQWWLGGARNNYSPDFYDDVSKRIVD